MALRNAVPLRWSPKGCVDALDGGNSFRGAMSLLTNLIPDATTDNMFVPRPAAISKYAFADFTAPGFVSCLYIVGNVAYGMVKATIGGSAGHDAPFAYDLSAGALIAIGSVTFATTPVSPPATGAWTPPTMAMVGTTIMVTHPGFDGATYFIGWLDVSTPSSPVWHAGNTATNALPGVPVAVANFNNRAYFAIANQVWYSDSLAPTTMTNAGQAITLGDTSPVVALSGNPLASSNIGGMIQSLIAFKNTIIYQITGDKALSNLTASAVPFNVGTYAPLSVVSTPHGVAFIAPDGLRFIDSLGAVSEPVGDHGMGIAVPFINAQYPSRICAAFGADTLRISVGNLAALGVPVQEWWFDFTRKIWTGPHTFPASLIAAYMDTFIMTPSGITKSLWQSDATPSSGSSYTENGVALSYAFRTALLPDTDKMALNALVEATAGIVYGLTVQNITATIYDQNLTILDQVFLPPNPAPPVWGTAIWGAFTWGGGSIGLLQKRIDCHQPIVFKQMYVQLSGQSVYGLRLGNMFFRYQVLGYETDGNL